MANEGMFVVVLTVNRQTGRLLTSPDIISRGFIYLRDSEELMNLIRQYLKQKIARSYGGRKVDLDVLKKEIKDEITHVLYDQTRRTPIVIPVINEIGGISANKQVTVTTRGNGERSGEDVADNYNQPKPFATPQTPASDMVPPPDRHIREI